MKNILPTNQNIINHFNLNIKELLNPRFEVIADYPKSEFKIGDILHRILYATDDVFHSDKNAGVGGLDLKDIEKYPHLFRKLNWWEKRNVNEMPEYLKQKVEPNIEIYQYEKIIRWEMNNTIGVISDKDMTCCDLELWSKKNQYLPATKKEYENYQG